MILSLAPPAPPSLAVQIPEVCTRREALELGLSESAIDERVKTKRWRILIKGVYYTRCVPPGQAVPLLARARGAALHYGPGAVVGFDAAAVLWGCPAMASSSNPPLHILVPPHGQRRRQPHRGKHDNSTILRWAAVDPTEVMTLQGVPVTSRTRTVKDVLSTVADPARAVCVLDSALNARWCTKAELLEVLVGIRHSKPRQRAMTAWQRCQEGAESPLETRWRLVFERAGLAPDVLQYDFPARSGFPAFRADMAWICPRGIVIVECDGKAFHGSAEALYRDRMRQNVLQIDGVTIVRVIWEDLNNPERVVELLRQALASRGR